MSAEPPICRGRVPAPACETTTGCITCGDVALPLVVSAVSGADALCHSDDGRSELVAVELVGQVAVGDRLLVHAGVALERLSPREDTE